jgi:CMP-N,N'-diacetyllegionaminic acid synthase
LVKKINILAVIPARSASKGIPNKNIKKIKGIPLLAYSIKYALRSKIIDKVIVSTDSRKYAKIAKKYKAEVPYLRKKKLSKDDVTDYPVINDALTQCEKIYKKKYNYVVLLRPTSPFREKNLIEKSYKLLKKNPKATSVRSVKKIDNHPYRSWILKNEFMFGFVKNIHEPYNIPRQKLPLIMFQTGDIEFIKRSTLIKGSISGEKVLPIIIKKYFDLDSPADLKKLKIKN